MAFSIANVTLADHAIGPGEAVSVSFDVVNATSYKLTNLLIAIGVQTSVAPTGGDVTETLRIAGTQAKNTTKRYSVTLRSWGSDGYIFDDLISGGLRSASGLKLVWYADIQSGSTGQIVTGTVNLTGALAIDRRCLPAVETFSLERATNGAPDDEGESLLATIKLGLYELVWQSSMVCRLYYAQGHTVDTSASYIDLTANVSDLLDGVTDDDTLITQTFSRGGDWAFLLTFGDAGEMASSGVFEVSAAFANLHLSGAATGGAAFGRFSSSTLNNPKLESEYPIYPYAGIEGVNNYAAGDALTGGHWLGSPIRRAVFTDTGVTSTGSVAVGTLAETPAVVLSVTGCYYRATDTMFRPLPFISYASINWATSAVVHDDGDVELYFGSSNTGSKDYVLVVDYVANV